jgi:biotin carboxylase
VRENGSRALPKRILLITATTGYQTRAFAEAAERLGYEVQLATDRCHQLDNPWGDDAIALRFQQPEQAAAMIAASGQKFDGIVAVGDRPSHIAALAAAELKMPGNPPDAVLACRSKYLARERFRAAGLPVPEFTRIAVEADPAAASEAARYPCVLKPLGLSASRGVIRANTAAEFVRAFERIRAILGTPDVVRMHEDEDRYIQVEDFIEGREFALEGILEAGRLDVIAIFDKPDPLDGPYFEETIYVTPSRENEASQSAMIEATQRAISALGLCYGPVHAEMRLNAAGVWMLEVAARPIGGLCAQVLRFEDGSGLEELVIRHAVGDRSGSRQLASPARAVMMIPIPRAGIYVEAEGVEDARSTAGINDVVITAKQGQKLLPLPEGASYLGFIFASGNTSGEAEQALRTAHQKLRFEIASALPVMK